MGTSSAERHILDSGRQSAQARATVTTPPALLAPRPRGPGAHVARRVDRARLFGLGAKHTQAKIADLAHSCVQRSLQLGFALREPRSVELMAPLGVRNARHGAGMKRLVLPGLIQEFDVLALGQRDKLLLKGLER